MNHVLILSMEDRVCFVWFLILYIQHAGCLVCDVAYRRQTTHSSAYYDRPLTNGYSCNGVDGLEDQTFMSGSCVHTMREANPWFQVDLGAQYTIDNIQIYARTDNYWHNHYKEFSNIKIEVSNGIGGNGDLVSPVICGTYLGPPAESDRALPVEITCVATCQYLRITRLTMTAAQLQFCTVKVHATLSSCPDPVVSWTCRDLCYDKATNTKKCPTTAITTSLETTSDARSTTSSSSETTSSTSFTRGGTLETTSDEISTESSTLKTTSGVIFDTSSTVGRAVESTSGVISDTSSTEGRTLETTSGVSSDSSSAGGRTVKTTSGVISDTSFTEGRTLETTSVVSSDTSSTGGRTVETTSGVISDTSSTGGRTVETTFSGSSTATSTSETTTNANSQASGSTGSTCLCPCNKVGIVTLENITREEMLEKLSKIIEDIKIDAKKTSLAKNKLISANDDRPSAKAVGSLGVIMLILVFGFIVVLDLDVYIRGIMMLKRFILRRRENSK